MQTHNLSSAALHGIGRVLSANTPYLEGRTPQPRTFEVGPETPCFRAVGTVGVDYQEGMALLCIFHEGKKPFVCYLDRAVLLSDGVCFAIIPLQHTCRVDFYSLDGSRTEELPPVSTDSLVPQRPRLPLESVHTIFYQECAQNFYFRGERHAPFELVYVDNGELHNLIRGQDIPLRQGELMLIGAGDWHAQYAQESVSFLSVSFTAEESAFASIVNCAIPLGREEKELVAAMMRERDQEPEYLDDSLEALLKTLLIRLLRSARKPAVRDASLPATTNSENRIVDCAVQYITANITRKLTLEEISEAVHASVPYLHRLFRQHLQMPPGKFITKIRMAECKERLREGIWSMGDIASQMGFSSPQHFSAQFRRWYGITPSEYVRTLR